MKATKVLKKEPVKAKKAIQFGKIKKSKKIEKIAPTPKLVERSPPYISERAQLNASYKANQARVNRVLLRVAKRLWEMAEEDVMKRIESVELNDADQVSTTDH